MKILFEEHHYVRHTLPDSIKALDESLFNQLTDAVKVDCVGYYFDAKLNDCVLILPKVLIQEETDAEGKPVEKVLGKYTPEEVLDFTSRDCVREGAVKDKNLPRETVKFLREFAVWIYRAVRVYQKQVKDSDNIVSTRMMSAANSRAKVESNNFLDILLELAKFNRENLDFFNRVLHNTHSGYNKINWTRTISKSQAMFQCGAPIYVNPVNRKWCVNYEEDLLIIFFSILQYCNEAYGFNNELRYGFKLMSSRTVERWIESGKGARTLNIFHSRCHFDDRLFDRDTLIVCHFDVNFLFVISMYARQKDGEKGTWQRKVRALFREAIQQELHDRYDFYALKAVGNALAGEKFLIEHYRELQGQVCRPFKDDTLYAMAMAKHEDSEGKHASRDRLDDLRELLKGYFVVSEFKLGEDPVSTSGGPSELQQLAQAYQAAVSLGNGAADDSTIPHYYLARYVNENFLVGSYHDAPHWKWITGDNDRGTLIYNVRIKSKNSGETRAGSQTETWWRKQKIKFAILFEEGHEGENRYRVYRVHDYAKMTQDRMEKAKYPRKPNGDYFIFRFDEEVRFEPLNLSALIAEVQGGRPVEEKYAPIVTNGIALSRFRSE